MDEMHIYFFEIWQAMDVTNGLDLFFKCLYNAQKHSRSIEPNMHKEIR